MIKRERKGLEAEGIKASCKHLVLLLPKSCTGKDLCCLGWSYLCGTIINFCEKLLLFGRLFSIDWVYR